jgi:hypothetical protein
VGTILIIYGAQKTYALGGMVCRNHRMLYGFTQLCWMHGMVCGNHIDYIWCTETIGCCMVSHNYARCMAWSVGTILIIYGAQKTYMPGGMVCQNHRTLYGFTQLCWMHGIVGGHHIVYMVHRRHTCLVVWCAETIGCCMV